MQGEFQTYSVIRTMATRVEKPLNGNTTTSDDSSIRQNHLYPIGTKQLVSIPPPSLCTKQKQPGCKRGEANQKQHCSQMIISDQKL